jgi:hypothetical protein
MPPVYAVGVTFTEGSIADPRVVRFFPDPGTLFRERVRIICTGSRILGEITLGPNAATSTRDLMADDPNHSA